MRLLALAAAAAVSCTAPTADDLVGRMEAALGGRPAYERVEAVAFTAVLRTRLGDRMWTIRRDRTTTLVEGLDAEGRRVTAEIAAGGDVRIERDSVPVEGPEAGEIAAEVRRQADLWLWGLEAPWRLRAPGVRLVREPRRADPLGGAIRDVLRADVPASVAGAAAGTYRFQIGADGRPVEVEYVRGPGDRGTERWIAWTEAGGVRWPAARSNREARVVHLVASLEVS